MHQAIPYVLTGLAGAAVPTAGIPTLVSKRNQDRTEHEKKVNELKAENKKYEDEILNQPTKDQVTSVVNSYFDDTNNEAVSNWTRNPNINDCQELDIKETETNKHIRYLCTITTVRST